MVSYGYQFQSYMGYPHHYFLVLYCFQFSYSLHVKTTNRPLTTSLPRPARWSAVALGGAVACLIMITATIAEWTFVPRKWAGAEHLSRRLAFSVCYAYS